MPDNRRSFIRKFGITLGSLVVSGSLPGCGPKRDEPLPNAKSQIGKQDEPSLTLRTPQWEQLRQCWLHLNDTQNIEAALTKEFETSIRQSGSGRARDSITTTTDALVSKHQAILDALVATGQVNRPVAEHMQVAFEEAVEHVIRSMMMCYYAIPFFEYSARNDLLQRAETLRKISADLDPATVAEAQTAIAQDIAYFAFFTAHARSHELPRGNYVCPMFEASPEALEAARLLTRLFLGTPD